MLSLLNAFVALETHWACIPDPPVFCFVNWEETNIPLYATDSEILGTPLLIILFLKERWSLDSLSIDVQALHDKIVTIQ